MSYPNPASVMVWDGEMIDAPEPDRSVSPGFGVQCCRDVDHPADLSYPVIVEPKIDGFRFLVGGGRVISRSGSDYTHLLGHWAEAVGQVTRGYVDGEIQARFDPAVDGQRWRSAWGKTQSLLRSRKPEDVAQAKTDLVFHAFDRLSGQVFEAGMDPAPLKERKVVLGQIAEKLQALPWFHLVESSPAGDWHQVQALYHRYLNQGFEGLVIKQADEPYVPSEAQRFRRWLRIKPTNALDVEILGADPGTGRHAGVLGALEVRLPDGKIVRVGSGFSNAQRESFWADSEALIGRMVEIRIQADARAVATARHPVFVRLRPDKKGNPSQEDRS